ncbi:MAG: proline--tRNA ligase [Oligoflexales bacterium]|nr:proline--tRNA ligase [Oligoflexales bacterium]
MRMSQLVGRTMKDPPRDSELISHKLLVRAGYIKQFASGIYGLMPLAHRVLAKFENIVREEMNRVGGQEIKMPCMSTRELWEESGRYQSIDKSMFRLNDRNNKEMCLCMTHEEPVVYIARSELRSYKQLPVMVYQIQTKFRDEPRPRGGLVRVREFTMKDGYSFHTSEEDLKDYYYKVHDAYSRIFKRGGINNFVSVLSDNGMFGGKFSHEFMHLVPSGEDTIITCSKCSYKANREISCSPVPCTRAETQPLQKVHTPNHTTIADLSKFLKITPSQTCRAVLYETSEKKLVIVFVRGDREVADTKLKGIIQKNVTFATAESIENANCIAGFLGPLNLDLDKVTVVFDRTITESSNLAIGANEVDHHYTGFNFARDFSSAGHPNVYHGDVIAVIKDDPCPECKSPLQETRGIEIGNIFHLGTRYSEAMNCTYLDSSGKACHHVMGCYGIGIGRYLASIIEESHDKFGMILPISVAPYEVHLVSINIQDEQMAADVDKIYSDLVSAGIEVLYDDRNEKAGSKFADADLIGIPLRLILSPKTLAEAKIEFKYRDGRQATEFVPLEQVIPFIKQKIKDEYQRYNV